MDQLISVETLPAITALQAAVFAFVAAVLLAPLTTLFCRAFGWVDAPNYRKHHEGLVPLAGGLTICGAVLLAGALVAPGLVTGATHFWLGAGMVFVIGFVDDRFPIRARFRFAVQLFAALVFVLTGESVPTELGQLLGPFSLTLGVLAIPFAVIGIAGLTNALNMMDGLDGLSGGLALVALCWLLVAFGFILGDASTSAYLAMRGQQTMLLIALVSGALIGFLLFNQRTPWCRRARMFLGDGGSMTMGFVVAAMCMHASSAFGSWSMTPVTAAWIAAVPLMDMFASILRRFLEGKTPMTPDRKHVHHLLRALGLSIGSTVAVLQLAAFLTGLIGVVGWRLGVPEYWMFWGLLAAFAGYFLASRHAWRRLESAGHDREQAHTDQGDSPVV